MVCLPTPSLFHENDLKSFVKFELKIIDKEEDMCSV